MSTPSSENPRRPGAPNWLLLGLVLLIVYYLVTEHWPHLLQGFGLLPYLVILACPLMHLFHHGRHGRHHRPPPWSKP